MRRQCWKRVVGADYYGRLKHTQIFVCEEHLSLNSCVNGDWGAAARPAFENANDEIS